MTYDRNEMLEDLYDARNDHDLEGVLVHLHPEVDWAEGVTGARIHGRIEVGSWLEKQWKTTDLRVEPMRIDVSPAGDKATVLVHQLVRGAAGAVVENARYLHVFTFDGAFVRKLDILEAPEEKDDEDGDED